MQCLHVWKSELYDDKLSYVSEFGKGVVKLLNPVAGEKILDLGCGSGDLAHEISKSGAVVTGIDLSDEMLARARSKYPHINFIVGNGENFKLGHSFDAVFSNAALHWMKNSKQVVESVWHHLMNGGRFVAEFGGKENIKTVLAAIGDVLLEEFGVHASERNPWYFPSVGEYSALLEQQGFRVTYAAHFDRPTKMEDGENGLIHWLMVFAESFFVDLSKEQKEVAFSKIEQKVKSDLYQKGYWYLDYKRLRIVAIKP